MSELTKEQFLKDVENHEMRILMDNESYRHLRFQKPGTINQYFDLITWPGHLAITGDMGSYTFSRAIDMFAFFRNAKLEINSGYWAEKCVAEDTIAGIQEYSRDRFRETIEEQFDSFYEGIEEHDRKELWDDIEDSVLIHADNPYSALDAAMSYKDDQGWQPFADHWEYTLQVKTTQYVWSLYAIVWGIQQFDKAKENTEAV